MQKNLIDPSLTDPGSYQRTRIMQDESDSFPPEPKVISHTIGGALADRVRRRMSADASAEVRLTETTIYGGYSEWTQENSTEFTITCDGSEVTFYPCGGTPDWREDAGQTWADSVFARFDVWLAATERPAELFAEWFTFEEENDRVVPYQANEDTILTRAVRELVRGRVEHITLTSTSDGYGQSWELHVFGSPQKDGPVRVMDTYILPYTSGTVVSPDVAREVHRPDPRGDARPRVLTAAAGR